MPFVTCEYDWIATQGHAPNTEAARRVESDLLNALTDLFAACGKNMASCHPKLPRPEFGRNQHDILNRFVNEEINYDRKEEEKRADQGFDQLTDEQMAVHNAAMEMVLGAVEAKHQKHSAMYIDGAAGAGKSRVFKTWDRNSKAGMSSSSAFELFSCNSTGSSEDNNFPILANMMANSF